MGFHTQESHLYNNRNNFITIEHPHGAYLASKPPMRKNKDYRPRPRNSVAGFSVYKTDFHERHWYTFLDVLQQDDAPIIRNEFTFFSIYLNYFYAHTNNLLFYKIVFFEI